jgi:hypothetical protein
MDNKVKRIFCIKIPYSINKYLEFTLYDFVDEKRHIIKLSIWKTRKLTDIPGYEDEWGGIPLKHITLLNKEMR